MADITFERNVGDPVTVLETGAAGVVRAVFADASGRQFYVAWVGDDGLPAEPAWLRAEQLGDPA